MSHNGDPDNLHKARSNGPMIYWKWWDDYQRSWDHQEFPSGRQPKCHVFTADYERCADGLSWERAKKECRPEFEDMLECNTMQKLIARHTIILKQRKKMIKEGKYTPPPFPESYPPFMEKHD